MSGMTNSSLNSGINSDVLDKLRQGSLVSLFNRVLYLASNSQEEFERVAGVWLRSLQICMLP